MKMAELTVNTERPNMKMVSIEQETGISAMNMVPLDEGAEPGEMNMTKLDQAAETPDMVMAEVRGDESKMEMNMTEVDMNVEHVKMQMAEQQSPEKDPMKINGGDIVMNDGHTDEETARKRMDGSKVHGEKKKELTLRQKMDMLIGLDMDEVEKAPMEELVKIIQVMNDVIGDAKKQMKMTSIETRSKVVGNSKMKM
jgi:hypothetical protein